MSTATLSSPIDRTALDRALPARARLRVVGPDELAPVRPARPAREVQPARPARSQVRLTRRGRLVVLVVCLLAVLAAGVALGAGSSATQEPGTPTPTRIVVVAPGETLWAIAGRLADDGDVRAMVDRIERLNALDTAMVQSGQRLRVPLAK